jgi:hypothetical protein
MAPLCIINNQIELIFIKPQANHPFSTSLLPKKVIAIKVGAFVKKE